VPSFFTLDFVTAMIYEKSVYPGEAFFPTDGNDVEKHNIIQRLTEAHAEIRSLYFSGAPVFTREIIQDVGQQLRKLEGQCGKVFIRGLNGIMVEFAIETGRIIPCGPDKEFIMYVLFTYALAFYVGINNKALAELLSYTTVLFRNSRQLMSSLFRVLHIVVFEFTTTWPCVTNSQRKFLMMLHLPSPLKLLQISSNRNSNSGKKANNANR
jgi:hypothetical protein